jgi:hypothetical protein
VDWVLRPETSEQEEVPAVLTTGSLRESLGALLPLVQKWFGLDSCPVAKRLALGAVLLRPVDSRQEGYERLGPYLKDAVKLDPNGSSDFRYTINRWRSSKVVPDLRMNRLTTWFVWVWRPVKLTVRVRPDAEVSREQEAGEQQMACRLDLDVNTAPEFEGVFDPPRQGELLQELCELTEEIAAKGDVA